MVYFWYIFWQAGLVFRLARNFRTSRRLAAGLVIVHASKPIVKPAARVWRAGLVLLLAEIYQKWPGPARPQAWAGFGPGRRPLFLFILDIFGYIWIYFWYISGIFLVYFWIYVWYIFGCAKIFFLFLVYIIFKEFSNVNQMEFTQL